MENPDPPTVGFTPGSDLAKALEGWVDNPSSEIHLATKKGKVRHVLLEYQLPGGQWVNNSPDLWDAIRYFGPKIVVENPQKVNALREKLQSLGINVRGIIDLDVAEWLIAFKESPETAPEPHSRIPPEYQVEYFMYKLRQGEDYLAARIARIQRKDIEDPLRALLFVREWKDKINERNRPALLNVGIAAITDIWNMFSDSDPELLQEALQFGKEALEIEKSSYTYCALQAIYRALDQHGEADDCIQQAELLGKPCQDTGRRIRRISATSDVEARGEHFLDKKDDLDF
ncbi:hypothetical protein [Meiothermus cerbereus]|uniref:hypothetical protein n=1 Tax=Meiothermus cerbereus TaxID=65552 RepID=UPI003EEECEE5